MLKTEKSTTKLESIQSSRETTSIPEDQRSKLHVSSTINWLKRRHSNTANLNYLLFPNEMKQHLEVKDVFEVFDVDKSG